jgi:4-diphosphocytidyl-2-C-methyl-D-erythritol kinase
MLVRAYAKINLGLRILRKRTDGYHDIETLFHRIDLFDEILLEPSDRITLSVPESNLPVDERNLCVRAAVGMQRIGAHPEGVRMTLKKRIPVGAGLGGGSSDAASTIRGLETFWDLHPDHSSRLDLARQLGADVPYFLQQGSAYATGTGDRLTYIDLTLPYAILLVYPGIHVRTAWAYTHCSPVDRRSSVPLHTIWDEEIGRPEILRAQVENDFEPVVFAAYPEIGRLRDDLLTSGALFAQLSGSGSSVYGLFATTAEAEKAARKVHTGYRTFITSPGFRPPDGASL